MDNNAIFNCLNIRSSTQKFLGEIQPSSNPDFKQFQSFAYGLHAGAKILLTYYRQYGLNTVTEIVSRWAPESDNNDTQGYIQFVADYMGRSSLEIFKVRDPAELTLLVDGIGHRENPVQYTQDDLQSGVNMALGT